MLVPPAMGRAPEARAESCVPGASLAHCTLTSLCDGAATRSCSLPEEEETGHGKIGPSLGSCTGSVVSIVLCEFSLKVNG